jgi:hypothetical protein
MSSQPAYDVFLSHRSRDVKLARRIESLLDSSGLSIYRQPTTGSAAKFADEIREALAECRALVLIMSPSALTSTTMAMEVGAAHAWQKAIFVVLHDIQESEIPSYLRGLQVFRAASLETLKRSVEATAKEMTAEHQRLLRTVYKEIGVATDRLTTRPLQLEHLARRFNRKAGTEFTPERVLQELIRMRKRGLLGSATGP